MGTDAETWDSTPRDTPRGTPDASRDLRAIFHFAEFQLDERFRTLSRNGRLIELRPCTFRLLAYLVQKAGQVVSRCDLFKFVWPGVNVSDGTLTQSIWELRKMLCEHGSPHELIRTVRGAGYCLTAKVLRHPWEGEDALGEQQSPTTASTDSSHVGHGRLTAHVNLEAGSTDVGLLEPSAAELREISRLLRERAHAVVAVEQVAHLVSAFDALITITRRHALTDLEIDARLARVSFLLKQGEIGRTLSGVPLAVRLADNRFAADPVVRTKIEIS